MVRLEARSVAFAYTGSLEGPVRAVDGVDLEVDGGDLLALIGPNGAGKSTLLKLLAGLYEPTAGSVHVNGEDVRRLAPRDRARTIAVVPQGLRTVPEVTVENFVLGGRYGHLGFWRRRDARDREIVRSSLAEADVAELGRRLLTELSGGQLQRVLIARALAQESRVLLVDEPTSSLDPAHQLATFGVIAQLTCEHRAVVVVTHDFNLASQFSTELGLLDEGRLVARGTAEEVLRPEVLEPVYGANLRFGRWPGPEGAADRPYVVPWLG